MILVGERGSQFSADKTPVPSSKVSHLLPLRVLPRVFFCPFSLDFPPAFPSFFFLSFPRAFLSVSTRCLFLFYLTPSAMPRSRAASLLSRSEPSFLPFHPSRSTPFLFVVDAASCRASHFSIVPRKLPSPQICGKFFLPTVLFYFFGYLWLPIVACKGLEIQR